MSIRDDFNTLKETIKTMDMQIDFFQELVDDNIQNEFGLDLKMKEVIENLTDEEIENLTEESLMEYLNSGFSGEGENTNLSNMKSLHMKNESFKEKEFLEYAKYTFVSIKNALNEVSEMRNKKDEIQRDSDNVIENWFTYVNSQEYADMRKKRIQEIKDKMEEEENEIEKKKLERMITSIENSSTMNFLFDRINKLGKKEINNILDVFFSNSRSILVIDKFKKKIKRLEFNPDIYKMFFNIEEKFLPEEYNDFNNLFLFHVMRFVSYADMDNKTDRLYVSSILSKLYNLLYHKFGSKEMEDEFIDLIKRFDDLFEDARDSFVEKNVTSPKHPERIKKGEEMEIKRRMMIISCLQNEGIEPDTTLSTEELREQLEKVIEKKQNENVGNEETLHDELIEDEPSDESSIETDNEEILKELKDVVLETVSDKTYSFDEEENHKVLSENEVTRVCVDIDLPEDIVNQNALKVIGSVDYIDQLPTSNVSVGDAYKVRYKGNSYDEVDSIDEADVSVNTTYFYDGNDWILLEYEPIDAFSDVYGNLYVEYNGTYDYIEPDGTIIEENISEETVLRLISSGALTKTKFAM